MVDFNFTRLALLCYFIFGEGIVKNKEKKLEESKLKERFGGIDAGVIEVALALAAISALLISEIDSINLKFLGLIIKLVGFISFMLSSYGAGRIYFWYLIIRFPNIYYLLKERGFNGFPAYFFRLAIRVLTTRSLDVSQEIETELGHLSILGAFLLVWIVAISWIVLSILPSEVISILNK